MGRPPLEKKQQQFTVALPPEVRSRLEAAATAAGHSIAEEIRRRIDQTISWETVDPVMRELLRGIENLSARLGADFGPKFNWHNDWQAHHAFAFAVRERLTGYEPQPGELGSATSDLGLINPSDLQMIARMRERDDRRAHAYPHLKAAQKHRWSGKLRSKKEKDHE
jgi:hypothetical protein